MRAGLPQHSVESSIQRLDLTQTKAEELGFHSDLTAEVAAHYIFAKLHQDPATECPSYRGAGYINASLLELNVGLPPHCIADVLSKEIHPLLCIGFQLQVFTPSEWVQVLHLRSAHTTNWPLPRVGTPHHAPGSWTAQCTNH